VAEGTIVRFIGVHKHYGTQDVLEAIGLAISPGEKVGLVGRNGAGKTTLLRLLLGLEETSQGQVIRTPGARFGYIPQQLDLPEEETVERFVLAEHRRAEEELRARELELAEPGRDGGARRLQHYQAALDAFERAGGHDAPKEAERLLDGLGLGGRLGQRIATLSGGERNVLTLARALLGEPELLVLDEPGNHLDYAGLAWLERFLASYRGAVLLVSHDRHLLDAVVGRIFELERRRVTEYAGNYSRYRMEKLRALVAQQADYNANQKRLEQLEALVKRFEEFARRTADPAWGKRLRARRSQLERERKQAVERPELDRSQIRLDLSDDRTKADIALRLGGYDRSWGERALFRGASLDISCGERVALVGPNGCGKTTFLRDLVEKGSWESSTIRVGPSLRMGYCAQNQETLDPARTLLETLTSLGVRTRHEALAVASSVLFGWEDLDKPVGALSGGEKNRLQLACLGVQGATFLVLDEPTNHMDLASREAIEESLAAFRGTLLVVSHDRYFLDKIATAVVEVRDGGFHRYPGDPQEFWQEWAAASREVSGRVGTRAREQLQATSASRRRERVAAASEIERRLAALEAEKGSLERELSDAFARGELRKGRDLSRRHERLLKLLDGLYAQWEAEEG
jgi:ATP-binding cassette subfamily F protein 3